MDDYEPHIIDITKVGDSHRRYIVRDYTGKQWEARGDRLRPDTDSAIENPMLALPPVPNYCDLMRPQKPE